MQGFLLDVLKTFAYRLSNFYNDKFEMNMLSAFQQTLIRRGIVGEVRKDAVRIFYFAEL